LDVVDQADQRRRIGKTRRDLAQQRHRVARDLVPRQQVSGAEPVQQFL